MRNPWEDSLILALRDAQWIRAIRRSKGTVDGVPGIFLKLSGRPEQSLGDLLVEDDERFYLLEVKSGRNQLDTEWSNVIEGHVCPKVVFLTLTNLVNEWLDQQTDASYEQALWTSLRCHHFIYWSDKVFENDRSSSPVHVVPYLVGCAQEGVLGKANDALGEFGVAEALKSRGDWLKGDSLPLSALLNKRGLVGEMEKRGAPEVRVCARLGVPLERFRDYLVFLSENGVGNGSLNAVVCSNKGYLRRLETFEDLRSILKKTKRPSRKSLKRDPVRPKAGVLDASRFDMTCHPFPVMHSSLPRHESTSPRKKNDR